MPNENEILDGLFELCQKLNNLEDPSLVAEGLLKQPQLPEFLMDFINSPYYGFNQKIEKKENILFILGYKLLSAIILALILYIKYKDKIKEPLKEAIKEGFKYAEAIKNEEAFILGFISKIKNYIPTSELEEILNKANFSPTLIYMEDPNILSACETLTEEDKKNIEEYTNILMNLIEKYMEKLGEKKW